MIYHTHSYKLKHQFSISDINVLLTPSTNANDQLRQLRALTKSYDDLASGTQNLPPPLSLVPRLMALDDLTKSTSNSKAAIEASLEGLQGLEDLLRNQQSSFSDADSLSKTMDIRIDRLRNAQEAQVVKSPEVLARELVVERIDRKTQLKMESQGVRQLLDHFVQKYLASMAAAEELGGPVTGELADVDEEVLATGFSAYGKPKGLKGEKTEVSNTKRQRRIDEIWGNNSDRSKSEQEAAYEELTKLIDDLLLSLQGLSDSGVYVDLKRDSAAARFLVRAKVAQFHPRDANKLRLVDFGRELDT